MAYRGLYVNHVPTDRPVGFRIVGIVYGLRGADTSVLLDGMKVVIVNANRGARTTGAGRRWIKPSECGSPLLVLELSPYRRQR